MKVERARGRAAPCARQALASRAAKAARRVGLVGGMGLDAKMGWAGARRGLWYSRWDEFPHRGEAQRQ